MTFEELKAKCRKGTCPSEIVLREIEAFIINEHSVMWRGGNRVNLSKFVDDTVKKLGIDVVVCIESIDKFLLNPVNAVQVYYGPGETDFEVRDKRTVEHPSGRFQKINDRYYNNEALTSYYEINKLQEILDSIVASDTDIPDSPFKRCFGLKWEVKVAHCAHCDIPFKISDLFMTEYKDNPIDAICAKRLSLFKNVRPDVSKPITGYHSHKNSWRFISRKAAKERSIAMGVELEMHSTCGNNPSGANVAAARILVDSVNDDPDFYFEWDGSLCEGGFEMITNPMTLEYGSVWWNKMLPIIRNVCVGYNVEKHIANHDGAKEPMNYGIHITMARKDLPDSVISKLAKFFDLKENQDFLQAIAQRRSMYGGFLLGNKAKAKAKDTLVFNKGRPGSMQSKDRSQPINIKSALVEFRMFRSTLNTVSFLKNLEFLDALINYYKEEMGVKVHHNNFLMWLVKNSSRYPNLLIYLKHPMFFVKGRGKVKNTWLPLLEVAKVKVKDPLKEYGPVQKYHDNNDLIETSMVEG